MTHRVRSATLILVGLAAMAVPTARAVQAREAPMSRPANLGVRANIVFLYYKDVPAAQRFYEDVLGLSLTVDQGFAKIYQVSPTSFVGLVDESQGLHRASDAKPVTVSFVTDQVDAWYAYLKSKGVKIRGEVRDATRHPTRGFVAIDPEGYFLEFETFLEHEQNARIRAALARGDQP
jgi:catechol 2,3-dioxygenase-like lactoylglutathione lyase family enzyme